MGTHILNRALVAVSLTVGLSCRGERAVLEPQGAISMAQRVSADAEWSAPVNFGPPISTQYLEHNPFLTKDGLSLYFTSDRPGGYGGWDLWVAHRATLDSPWEVPENVGPNVNSSSLEAAPYISRDGHSLYFESDRSGGSGSIDMLVSWRDDIHDDHAWQPPVNLGPEVNGPGPEGPVSIQGPDFYFARNSIGPAARFDIFVSRMYGSVFGEPQPVAELNSVADDRAPSIRFDGREIFLTSNRAGGFGDYDLWTSVRAGGGLPWSNPVNLGPTINTPYLEVGPMISEDGNTLLFVSNRPGGYGSLDLYYSTRIPKQ